MLPTRARAATPPSAARPDAAAAASSPAARQHSSGKRREEAGTEHRRLAATRRADDAEEAGADEAGDELGDEPLTAEEVLGIDGLEARETLERAWSLDRRAGRSGGAREDLTHSRTS